MAKTEINVIGLNSVKTDLEGIFGNLDVLLVERPHKFGTRFWGYFRGITKTLWSLFPVVHVILLACKAHVFYPWLVSRLAHLITEAVTVSL